MRASREMEPLKDREEEDAEKLKRDEGEDRQKAKQELEDAGKRIREAEVQSEEAEQTDQGRAGDGAVKQITRDAAGQLVVRIEGRDEEIVDARVARCFPWSLPESYVSVRDKDGKEVALLRTLDELDEASREIVAKELEEKIFNPKIQRLTSYKNEFGVVSITAQTDRGEVTFQIRSRDDVRLLSPGRALFRDADGNTYELADFTEMDTASQKWLEQYF